MISFLEQIIETPAWSLISDKLDAIIRHVILPTLVATLRLWNYMKTTPTSTLDVSLISIVNKAPQMLRQ